VAPATLLNAREHVAGLVALETDFVFPREQVGLAFREHTTLLPGARVVMGLVREMCAGLAGAIVSA
jgi:hypothetical protein